MSWNPDSLSAAVRGYFAEVDALDVEATLAYFADDATMTIQTANVTHTGKDGIRRMLTDFYGHSNSIRHELLNVVVEADKGKVATEQNFMSETTDGDHLDMHNCSFYDFNERGEFTRVIIWMAGTSPLV